MWSIVISNVRAFPCCMPEKAKQKLITVLILCQVVNSTSDGRQSYWKCRWVSTKSELLSIVCVQLGVWKLSVMQSSEVSTVQVSIEVDVREVGTFGIVCGVCCWGVSVKQGSTEFHASVVTKYHFKPNYVTSFRNLLPQYMCIHCVTKRYDQGRIKLLMCPWYDSLIPYIALSHPRTDTGWRDPLLVPGTACSEGRSLCLSDIAVS